MGTEVYLLVVLQARLSCQGEICGALAASKPSSMTMQPWLFCRPSRETKE